MLIRSEIISSENESIKLKVMAEGVTCVEQSGYMKWMPDSSFASYSYDASKFGARGVNVEVLNQELSVIVFDPGSGFVSEKEISQNKSTSLAEEFDLDFDKILSEQEQDRLRLGQRILKNLEVFIRARQEISASNGVKEIRNQSWTQLLRVEIESTQSGMIKSQILR